MIHTLLHSHMTLTYICISSYGLSAVIKLREQVLTSWSGIRKSFFPNFMMSLLCGQDLTNLCISTHGLWINNSHRIWTTCTFFEKVSIGYFH